MTRIKIPNNAKEKVTFTSLNVEPLSVKWSYICNEFVSYNHIRIYERK